MHSLSRKFCWSLKSLSSSSSAIDSTMAGLTSIPFNLSQLSSSTSPSQSGNDSSGYTSPRDGTSTSQSGNDSSGFTSPRDGSSDGLTDVEKAGPQRPTRPTLISARTSRIQSITGRGSWAAGFTHRLSHMKTSKDFIVYFEGPDDPFHPRNWPFRKKVVTTLLYALTTAGITMATSM